MGEPKFVSQSPDGFFGDQKFCDLIAICITKIETNNQRQADNNTFISKNN